MSDSQKKTFIKMEKKLGGFGWINPELVPETRESGKEHVALGLWWEKKKSPGSAKKGKLNQLRPRTHGSAVAESLSRERSWSGPPEAKRR